MNRALYVIFIFCIGCEVEHPWSNKLESVSGFVVDGIITDEYKVQRISLTRCNSDTMVLPVSGAVVTVTDSNTVYTFSESLQTPGTYNSEPFKAFFGKRYKLNIKYNSKDYSAFASMVPVSSFIPASIETNEKKGLYWYNNVKYGDPAMIIVDYDWSANLAYCSDYGSSKARGIFYILNNIDENQLFAPDKEIIYFPGGTKIVRKKFGLSADHQLFIRSLLMETEWRGGIFDVQQGNVFSNITNGAHGFFGVCSVISDSLTVK